MQSETAVIDWRQRVLFFTGAIAVLFAVAMFAGFTMQWWWWWRELAFVGVACICIAFMRYRLFMVAAIGLFVVGRLLFTLLVYLSSARHGSH